MFLLQSFQGERAMWFHLSFTRIRGPSFFFFPLACGHSVHKHPNLLSGRTHLNFKNRCLFGWSLKKTNCFYLHFYFWLRSGHTEVPGPRLNLCRSCDMSPGSDNGGSLTCWGTGELLFLNTCWTSKTVPGKFSEDKGNGNPREKSRVEASSCPYLLTHSFHSDVHTGQGLGDKG